MIEVKIVGTVLEIQDHPHPYLKNSSRHRLGSPHEVTGGGAIALPGAVDLGEGANASRRADVQMTRHGGGAHEEPVGIVGSLLVEAGQLDQIRPLGDLHLAGLLEKVGETHDELLLIDIFHARHFDGWGEFFSLNFSQNLKIKEEMVFRKRRKTWKSNGGEINN